MHWQEVVDIKYTGKLVVTGYCKKTGHCFQRDLIEAPKGATQTPKKLSTVERLYTTQIAGCIFVVEYTVYLYRLSC